MYVDVSELVNEVGVMETVSITLSSVGYETDRFGDVIPVAPIVIDDVKATIVETNENGFDSKSGSYMLRVVFDIYIPNQVSVENDLSGATFVARDGRTFLANKILLSRRYASHAVIRCTEVGNL